MPDESKPLIGVVCGSDAAQRIVWDLEEVTRSVGNNDSLEMLKHIQPGDRLKRMHLAPNYFRQQRRWQFLNCDLIWNAISDEIQNPKTLMIAQKIIAERKLPVINPPALISRTSRTEIARRLSGIDGVRAPKVLVIRNPTLERLRAMADREGFVFPAIVRRVGTHNGEVLGIFPDAASLEAIFGDRRNAYNLIEYVDIRRGDGLYRKTRFFFVGDQIVTRQHIVSDSWMVHGGGGHSIMPSRPELLEEARDMLVNGFAALPAPTRQALHEIRTRIGLDYCGIDCYLAEDGEIVVFECNATMNFKPAFRNPVTQYNRASMPRFLSALRRLVHAKTGKGPSS